MKNNSVTEVISETKRKFVVEEVRSDFPILSRLVNDKPLVYLDNAATTQKPTQVIDSIVRYYTYENANIHRGLHFLSEIATENYEKARVKVKEFINAMSASEIIFVRGATEGINLISTSLCRAGFFKPDDEILVTQMEHHANIVPWQLICDKRKIKLRAVPITSDGELDMEAFKNMVNEKTRLISVVHISNALGTVNPIKEIVDYAHLFDIPVVVDGSQSVPHIKVDVQDLDCDFFVFSGHKMYAPTGIGVLYGKTKVLELLPPYQGGGDMIRTVSFEETTFEDLPNRFEAGTPHIEGGIALGTAIDYLSSFNRIELVNYENELLKYATEKLSDISGLKIIGTAKDKSGVISFIIDGIHPYDIGTIIDTHGIAIRTGQHCTQPIMQYYGLQATARASFAFYNTFEEIDKLYDALLRVIKLFKD